MDSEMSSEVSLESTENKMDSGCNRICNVESRLRLKRTNVQSKNNRPEDDSELDTKQSLEKSNSNDRFEKDDVAHDTSAPNEGDSILDFKSPKSKRIKEAKLPKLAKTVSKRKKNANSKIKILVNNRKDTRAKENRRREVNSNVSQPSIESSFFKSKSDTEDKTPPADVKTALLCPLCFKPCKDAESQAIHMKICATRQNVSTKKLLDAIELQKRQADERKSLGLLAAPAVQDRKKPAPRKMNLYENSDLQLALALSKSLHEVDEFQEYEAETPFPLLNIPTSDSGEAARKGQLEKFGFANSRELVAPRPKRRKQVEITVLQTRTEDERNRILTEKIAQILMGNEAITQSLDVVQSDGNNRQKVVVKRRYLRDYHSADAELWNKTRLTPRQKSFYVPDLSPQIVQPEEHSEDENEKSEDIRTPEIACKPKDSELHDCESEEKTEKKIFSETLNVENLYSTNETSESCCLDLFSKTLASNWRNALNDSSASDVVIFVNDDKHIWAHKLVFFVRCSNILLDITSNDGTTFTTVKEKIFWTNVSYDIALAFLEFIYSGSIKQYESAFKEHNALSNLRNLARKYKVKELFAYLQKKESMMMEQVKTVERVEETEIEEDTSDSLTNSPFTQVLKEDMDEEKLLQNQINLTPVRNIMDQIGSASPDLFDDTMTDDAMTIILEKCRDQKTCTDESRSEDLSTVHQTVQEKEDTPHSQTELREVGNISPLQSIASWSSGSVKSVREISVNIQEPENNESDKNCTPVKSVTVTPVSSNRKRRSLTLSSIPRQKSNLSLFIEQVQKENAKSDFDTDSDVDSVLEVCTKLNRNPFNLKPHDDSDVNNDTSEKVEKRKNGLDMLEYNMTIYQPNVLNNDSIQNIDCSVDLSTSPELRRSTESADQDVENDEDCSTNLIEESLNSPERRLNETVNRSSVSPSKTNETVSSECDTDENEMSMYSRYKRKHRDNSIAMYRARLKKLTSNDSVRNESLQDDQLPKTDDVLSACNEDNACKESEEITILSDIEFDTADFATLMEDDCNKQQTDKLEISNLLESSIKERENVQTGSIDVHVDSPNISSLSFSNRTHRLRYTKSDTSIRLDRTKEQEFSVSPEPIRQDERCSLGSPVLICSSPELNPCDDLNNKDLDDEIDSIFQQEIYLANVDVRTVVTPSPSRKSNSLKRHKSVNLMPNDSYVGELESERTSVSAKSSVRKLGKKSVSEGNFHIIAKNVESDTLKNDSDSQCKCGQKKIFKRASKPVIIRDNVTPPPLYDGMQTPELHEQLKKYGLKLQKRKRAIKLLTYIYDELHPVVSTTENLEDEHLFISSEDEEPPVKRFSQDTNAIGDNEEYRDELQLSQDSVSLASPTNMIAEEMEFDEPELTNVAKNTLTLKEMFKKLIKGNRELYNKILTYEPLCIESLHGMLKAEGFKCKVNALMDFLDEECITFYVQENNVNGRTKKT